MSSPSSRNRRLSLFVIVSLLIVIGLGQAIHRHNVYEVPWFPGTEKFTWSIEARIRFTARGDPVSVSLRRPGNQSG